MVELVAEQGYDGVAIAALSRRARVSKRDFYRRFGSKEECFVAAYDAVVRQAVSGILAAVTGEAEWRERLRLAIFAFCDQVAEHPEAARLALVESFAAGAAASERIGHANRLFEELVATDFTQGEAAHRLPPLVAKGIVAGCFRVARARLLAGACEQLTLDRAGLAQWALSLCDKDVGRLRVLGSDWGSPLPPAAVEIPDGDERAMILAATLKLAGSEGYAALTVPRVRAAAGVSRRSFDTHFDGIADCYMATLEMLSDRALATAEPFYAMGEDWATGIQLMIARLCQQLAGDGAFTGLLFSATFSPSLDLIRWRSEMIVRLAATLRRGAPSRRQPSALAAEASVGAMWGVIHHLVATGRGARLPTVAPALSYLALAPTLGGAAAVNAIGPGCATR